MPYDNPNESFGPPGSISFGGDGIGGLIAYEWNYSGGNQRKPRITTSATIFSGITTLDGEAGIPALIGLPLQINALISLSGQSITEGLLYNFDTTTGKVLASVPGGTAVKAMETQNHSGGGSPETYALWFEIWKPRG